MQICHNDQDRNMEIRSKLWIEIAGEPVFGRGRMMLLRAIDKYGSINQAAKEINISYRKAWGYIKAMEDRLKIQLVDRQVGGKNGGGCRLTQEAIDFIDKYDELERDINSYVDAKFKAIYKGGG